MQIERPAPADIDEALAIIVAAFATEPIMAAFFPGPDDVRAANESRFFWLLLAARLVTGAPVWVARDGGRIAGIAMGYDTRDRPWPNDLTADWAALEAEVPGLADRFADYDRVVARGAPAGPHWTLGVIAVDPGLQGRGIGAALMRTFCAAADADPAATGVLLEASNPANPPWYRRFGFEVTASGPVGAATLVTMVRPRPATT